VDIAALRAQTPGCSEVLHFNNAGAALMPDPVFEAMQEHLDLERRIGGYEAAAQNLGDDERFYTSFAKMFNAAPDELAFMESATRGWVNGVYGLGLGAGDRILTHESEYISNYLGFLQLKKRFGIEVDLVRSDPWGAIDLDALEAGIMPRTRAIALTHVPTQGGLVNPAVEVGKIAKAHGLIYVLDACQSVGQLPLDVKELGCDLMSGTGRKWLRGPRGTGFLYVRRGFLDQIDPPVIDLVSAEMIGADAFEFIDGAGRFEAFEYHVAGKIGLAKAVEYALELGLEDIETRVKRLAEDLRGKLTEIGCVVTDLGRERCGIVTFTHPRLSPEALVTKLHGQAINISMTKFSTGRLDFEQRGLDDVARASTHYYNDDDEIERFVAALKAA